MSLFAKVLGKVFGSKQDRDIKYYEPIVGQINAYSAEYQSLSNDALRGKTVEFRQRIADYL